MPLPMKVKQERRQEAATAARSFKVVSYSTAAADWSSYNELIRSFSVAYTPIIFLADSVAWDSQHPRD
jgi:hypothetical protein